MTESQADMPIEQLEEALAWLYDQRPQGGLRRHPTGKTWGFARNGETPVHWHPTVVEAVRGTLASIAANLERAQREAEQASAKRLSELAEVLAMMAP